MFQKKVYKDLCLVGFIQDIDKEKCFKNSDDIFPTIYRVDRITITL